MKFVVASVLVATCAAQVTVDDFWDFDFDSETCTSTDEGLHKGCYENTNLDYSAVADCLDKHPGDSCLSHLTVTAKKTDQFALRTNCNATYELQELDVEGFFFAVTDYETISSSESFVVNFSSPDTVNDDCEMKIEFLPNPISNCGDPKKDNAAVVRAVTVAKGTNSFLFDEVSDVFKTGQSPTTALVTYTEYSQCGQGVLSITHPTAIEFEFQPNRDQEPVIKGEFREGGDDEPIVSTSATTSSDATTVTATTSSDATTVTGTTSSDATTVTGTTSGDVTTVTGTSSSDATTVSGTTSSDATSASGEEEDEADEGDDDADEGDDGADEGDGDADEGDADVEKDTTDSSSVTIAVAGIFSVGAALTAL